MAVSIQSATIAIDLSILLAAIPFSILFFRRRNSFPIKHRYPGNTTFSPCVIVNLFPCFLFAELVYLCNGGISLVAFGSLVVSLAYQGLDSPVRAAFCFGFRLSLVALVSLFANGVFACAAVRVSRVFRRVARVYRRRQRAVSAGYAAVQCNTHFMKFSAVF